MEIKNMWFFRDLSNFYLEWKLLKNGKVEQSKTIQNINARPGAAITVQVPYTLTADSSSEYYLQVTAKLKKDEGVLKADTPLAFEEFKLLDGKPFVYNTSKNSITVADGNETLTVKNKNFFTRFNKETGNITSYKINDKPVFEQGPDINFWRPPNDNDFGADLQKKLAIWQDTSVKEKLVNLKYDLNEEGWVTVIVVRSLLDDNAALTQTFHIDGSGALKVNNDFKVYKGEYPEMFKFGNHIKLPTDFVNIEWYGRGPWENYWDRKTSSFVGDYSGAIINQYYPYIRPQESGNKADVRWAKLTREDGSGIMIMHTDTLLNIKVIQYSPDQLFPGMEKRQTHSAELVRDNYIHLDVDLQQMGLGGINSWGALPLKEYRLPYQNYSYSYLIIPLSK
jgi:beta-galactosidase